VPLRRLVAGQPIGAGDVRIARVRGGLVRGEPAHTLEQVVGMTPRAPVNPGQPLLVAELARPLAVAKGAVVAMELSAPGLQVLGQGRALEQGGMGDRIQVLNPASRAVLMAEIVGHDRVRVAPGSTPVQPAAAQLAALR